jgi:hypothetical protein
MVAFAGCFFHIARRSFRFAVSFMQRPVLQVFGRDEARTPIVEEIPAR